MVQNLISIQDVAKPKWFVKRSQIKTGYLERIFLPVKRHSAHGRSVMNRNAILIS